MPGLVFQPPHVVRGGYAVQMGKGVFALGLIVGLGITITIALGMDLKFTIGAVCESNETPVVCARNWGDMLAFIAGAAVIAITMQAQRIETARHTDTMRLTLRPDIMAAQRARVGLNLIRNNAKQVIDDVEAIRVRDPGRYHNAFANGRYVPADFISSIKEGLDNKHVEGASHLLTFVGLQMLMMAEKSVARIEESLSKFNQAEHAVMIGNTFGGDPQGYLHSRAKVLIVAAESAAEYALRFADELERVIDFYGGQA